MVGETARSTARTAASPWTIRRYADESRTLGNSALVTAPVVLLYEVGLLLLGDRGPQNAAGALIDRGLMALGRPGALAVNLLVLAGFLVFAIRRRPRKATPLGLLVPVILESAAYACVLGASLRISQRLPLGPALPEGTEGVVLALGAGFYEELVFRLVAVGGTLVLLDRLFGRPSPWLVLVVLVVSAVGFSAFHHAGPGSERFTASAFVARSVAGVLLGALFILRGFGVACYTHVIYDLLCVWVD
jgi:hypothetical protein